MDGGEHRHQSLGICHRLYNSMKSLATYALKIMTSIHPVYHGSAQHDHSSRSASVVHPVAQGTPLHEAEKLGAKFESREQANVYEQDKGVSSTSSYDPPQVEEERRLEQDKGVSSSSNGPPHVEEERRLDQDKGVSSSFNGPPHVEEERILEQETSFSGDPSQARGPKKMVSINENVETMKFTKKRSRKKEVEVDIEPRPLKPILKLSSDLKNGPDHDMLINPANGA